MTTVELMVAAFVVASGSAAVVANLRRRRERTSDFKRFSDAVGNQTYGDAIAIGKELLRGPCDLGDVKGLFRDAIVSSLTKTLDNQKTVVAALRDLYLAANMPPQDELLAAIVTRIDLQYETLTYDQLVGFTTGRPKPEFMDEFGQLQNQKAELAERLPLLATSVAPKPV